MATSEKLRFVVGIDFGTTFTSVAYAHSSSPDDVRIVQQWPNNAAGISADQVPTEVLYPGPDRKGDALFGYQISSAAKRNRESLKWFKLLLQDKLSRNTATAPAPGHRTNIPVQPSSDPSSTSDTFDDDSSHTTWTSVFAPPKITPAVETANTLHSLNIDPITVVIDFLRHIRQVALASIKKSYPAIASVSPTYEYVLTIPAIWSDSAKTLMAQAVTSAGYGTHRTDFKLVSEPEAAAAYVLSVHQHGLQTGKTFVVCDAGGGTVDLISYKITNLDPLRINEVVAGAGDLCGSVYLNGGFENYIRMVLGKQKFEAMSPKARSRMRQSWEQDVKFKFGSISDNEYAYEVNIPGIKKNTEENFNEDSFHTIDKEDIEVIFLPVVDRIVSLVTEQVEAVSQRGESVESILLVGGFGSSRYLEERLKQAHFGGRQIRVIQPVNAQTATARGALLRGLKGSTVTERRSRRHIGCSSDPEYTSKAGQEGYHYWCSANKIYRVRDYMTWYVARDEELAPTETRSFSFFRMVAIPSDPSISPILTFEDDLMACDEEEAPDFKWKKPDAVYRLCTLKTDLSGIDTSKFTKTTCDSGQSFYCIDYDLKMTLEDETLRFELLFEQQSYGHVRAEFD